MRTNRLRPRSRSRSTVAASTRNGDSTRRAAELRALTELQSWRARSIPDTTAPLAAEDLVRLLHDCMTALELDAAIASGFTVNTVHYYRRKDIIDPPDGRTAAARYDVRHLWQIAGARLAGHLGLVTLAEARAEIRAASDATLLAFLAARVTDARAGQAMRADVVAIRPSNRATTIRPLPGVATASPASQPTTEPAVLIALPGNAWCVIPATHDARHSAEAAGALARALATALRDTRTV